jgi:hypothetical protein
MLLHLMPATFQKPRTAVHYGLLASMHDTKVINQMTVYDWMTFLNMQERRRNRGEDEVFLIMILNRLLF